MSGKVNYWVFYQCGITLLKLFNSKCVTSDEGAGIIKG